MKNQECDGTPALPLLIWGPCRRVSGRAAQSFFGAFSPRGLLQQHVQQSQCSETDPTPGRPCGECPTSIRRHQRPARSCYHLEFKQKAGHKPFPSLFENNPSCSHLAEWGLSDRTVVAVVVGTFLASLGGPAPSSTFTPPPWPRFAPLCLCPPQSMQAPSCHHHQGGQIASFRDTLPDLSL